ncbi:MAG: hypothetical protein ABFS46_10935, partial [Myxococcota bacterium]
MFASLRRRRSRQLPIFLLLAALTAWVAHARGSAGGTPAIGDPASGVPGSAARIEVVFVLDTTGSMSGLIEGAKQKIWSIANQLASGQPRPEIRVGLVAYRDRGDAFVTRRVDLTGDIDAINNAHNLAMVAATSRMQHEFNFVSDSPVTWTPAASLAWGTWN